MARTQAAATAQPHHRGTCGPALRQCHRNLGTALNNTIVTSGNASTRSGTPAARAGRYASVDTARPSPVPNATSATNPSTLPRSARQHSVPGTQIPAPSNTANRSTPGHPVS
jgi:hypothetical protein